MNKQCYRLIFNQVRGLLMAVAEIVPGCRKQGGGQSGRDLARQAEQHSARFNLLNLSVLAALGSAILIAPMSSGQVVVDPNAPGNQKPQITNAANGMTVVNIQTPSSAGVSRNTYTQFDVDKTGLILNNARTDALTQGAGWIAGNSLLQSGSARVILNEVNSANPSSLRGYIETAGSAAQVIIANPSGVTCDGCGFINASRVTLTTGSPILSNGSLDGFRVQKGVVTITGDGLNSINTDYTDIIARSVQINGKLWSKDLKVTTGANQVNADNSVVTPIAGTGAAPVFAIDTSSLGGMYATKIHLIGTEAGVGVNNAGYIGAYAGEVRIDSQGHLINSGSIIGNTLNSKTSDVNINTVGDVVNTGGIGASGQLTVSAANVDNRTGKLLAEGDISLTASQGQIQNSGSLIRANGTLTLVADQIDNTQTQGVEQGLEGATVNLQARHTDNQEGRIVADDINLTGAGDLNNIHGKLSASGNLKIQDADLANKTLSITNTEGTLIAGKTLLINSAQLTGDGHLLSQQDINIQLSGDFTNSGEFTANGNATLKTDGALLNQAVLQAGDTLTIQSKTLDNQSSAQILASTIRLGSTGTQRITNYGLIDGGETRIIANTLNNLDGGRIYGDHIALGLDILNNQTDQAFNQDGMWTEGPVIASRTRMDLGVKTLNSHASQIYSLGDIHIGGALDEDGHAVGQADSINIVSASIESLTNIDIHAKQINLSDPYFESDIVVVDSQDITEYQGSGSPTRYTPSDTAYIYTDESLHLHTPQGDYETWNEYNYTRTTEETWEIKGRKPQLIAGENLHIEADSVVNDKGWILAGDTLDGTIGDLKNIDIPGTQIVTDQGQVTNYWRDHQKGQDGTGSSVTSYQPPARISDIRVSVSTYEGHSGSGHPELVLGARTDTGQINNQISNVMRNSSLYHVNSDPANHYLIETDPRFTNHQTWLSSFYLQDKLQFDPDITQKRIGDGFYEQQLIREQVGELTGRRFLDGYANDTVEYQALMDNGVSEATTLKLVPGIALTADQIKALTSDIVWLVEKEVTLQDGSTQKVLTPQVYVRVRDGDISPTGALLSGDNINLTITGDLFNGGTIAGRNVVTLNGSNIDNQGGTIAGDTVDLNATHDINNIGGQIEAHTKLDLSAEGDINVTTTLGHNQNEQGSATYVNQLALLYVDNGKVTLNAGNDVNLQGAQIVSNQATPPATDDGSKTPQTDTGTPSEKSDPTLSDKSTPSTEQNTVAGVEITAKHDITLSTIEVSSQNTLSWDSNNVRHDSEQQEVGSQIQSQQGISLNATHDATLTAAQLSSVAGEINVSADHDVVINAGETHQTVDETHQHEESGLFSSKTITTRDTLDQTLAQGSTLSGNSINIDAGNNVKVIGSNVAGTEDVSVQAGNDLSILAATNTLTETHYTQETKSGIFGTDGGIGFTIGTQQTTDNTNHQATTQGQSRSMVGSTSGDLTLNADNAVKVSGSDIVAKNDINIEGTHVDIDPGKDQSKTTKTHEFDQSGLTVALSSPIITAIQTATEMVKVANESSDTRVTALAGMTAALAVNNGYDAYKNMDLGSGTTPSGANSGGGTAFSVSITYGETHAKNETVTEQASYSGSTVRAGNDINIVASGDESNSNINIIGSDVSAKHDVALDAEGNVNLIASQDVTKQNSDNASSSWGAGLAITVGNGVAFGFTANGSLARGSADGVDQINNITHINAGNDVVLDSGKDTNMIGAVVSGNTVDATVGGDLNIASVQNTSTYDSKNQNIGASVTVGLGFSGSINVGQEKINSDYASVTEQSGIKAGNGGFDVTVAGNTDLTGSVIASEAGANQNSFTTGTLTTSTIENKSEYTASSLSLGGAGGFGLSSSSGNTDTAHLQTFKEGASGSASAPSAMYASDSDSGQTVSAISDGTINITDNDGQLVKTGKTADQTIAQLNHDTDNANQSVSNNFDQAAIEQAFAVTKAFVQELNTFTSNRAAEADALKKKLDAMDDPESEDYIALNNEYQDALQWLPGGEYGRIITVLQTAASGNVTGGMSNLVQNAVVGYLQSFGAEEIKDIADQAHSEELRTALHAIAACTGAVLTDQSCGSGAMGAAGSVILNNLLDLLQDTNTEKMTQSEKEERKNSIASLLLGIASAAGLDAATVNGAAQIEMENNKLISSRQKDAINNFVRKAVSSRKFKSYDEQVDFDKKLKVLAEAAGCAITHCSAQYKEGSVEYATWKAIEELGNQPELKPLIQQLLDLKTKTGILGAFFDIPTSVFSPYGITDKVSDKGTLFGNWVTGLGTGWKDDVAHSSDSLASAIADLYQATRPQSSRTPSQGINCQEGVCQDTSVKDGLKSLDTILQSSASLASDGMDLAVLKDILVVASTTGLKTLSGVVAKDGVVDAASVGTNKTGTIWDSIQTFGETHPGSVIPQKFELTLENGQKIWVDGNATKHLAEYASNKAVYYTPEAVRAASQAQLESLSAAVNTASNNGIVYRQMMRVDGWELIFAPPKSAGQFPALYHALYKGK